ESTITSPYNFPVGTTTVTVVAENSCGTDIANFDVTVEDNEDPEISGMPADIVQDTDAVSCDAVVTWDAPTATDNCAGLTFTSNYESGATFPLGTTTVTYTADDGRGNVVTASFDVTVEDNEDPEISGMPADIVQDTDAVSCDAVEIGRASCRNGDCVWLTVISNYEI